MKKMNFLKIAFTFVLALVMTAAIAQNDPADYGLISTDGDVSYVTLDATIPFYVTPDANYHPTWAAFSTNLTAGFTWNYYTDLSWTIGTELALAITDNYVEITANTVGSYPINVKEEAPAAFGGCEDATGVDFTVNVIAKPTADITGAAANNVWNTTTAGHEYYICGDALAENITIGITETGVPAALASYAYSVQKRVVNINNLGVETGAATTTTPVDRTIATKNATATINGGTEVFTTAAMPVVGGLRTKYEFTMQKATDAAAAVAEGIVSAVSHKSDYLTVAGAGNITGYPFTGTVTVVYIVNPAPTTGPIYHIPTTDFL
ncbi:MAG: hypothetical protein JEY96_00025 [Bacteroidales bacterium]|nr:hypothetical protein [Bacteroidales bacterium]